jgi:8-oxo-dGTP pyrophosphatase MutT (NUDIX family)
LSAPPKPSGTVVVLRDAEPGLEVLLLQRAARDGSHGPWVFPGGKVEPADRADAIDAREDARRAAIRETQEESGLILDPASLTSFTRWVTPSIRPKRFDTWFFIAPVPASARVQVDGEEMVGHRWLTPQAGLDAPEIGLAPPQFVTLSWLAEFADVASATATLAARKFITFRPLVVPHDEGACILYPGDAGYEARDPEAAGPKHRLWVRGPDLRYERSGG